MNFLIKALVALVLLAVPLQADDTPKPVTPALLQLQIQAEHDSYFGGEPIILTVTLTNASDKPRDVGLYGPKAEWMVKGEDGKALNLTAQGNAKSVRKNLVLQNVLPGKSLVYKVVINRFYDMTAAGTYEITGKRWPVLIEGEPAGTNVASNSIKISVAEDDVREK